MIPDGNADHQEGMKSTKNGSMCISTQDYFFLLISSKYICPFKARISTLSWVL